MHDLLKKAIPPVLREKRYKLRRLGPARYAAYQRLERSARRKPLPAAGEPFDLRGGAIVLHASTVHAVRSHWVDYGHGIEELNAFRRLAPEHDLFIDIGAAEGIFSGAFCALTGKPAWAFEPSPEMFERLTQMCLVNPGFSITRTNVALGAIAGTRQVKQYPDGQFSGVGAPLAAEGMTVATLDEFADAHGLHPDFAKIDVEGMELDVLRGGERTLRRYVQTILLEVHYDMLHEGGQSMEQLQVVLDGYGFGLESLSGTAIDDLSEYARENPEQQPGYTIIVCRKSRAGGVPGPEAPTLSA